jgi:hypothetical protein
MTSRMGTINAWGFALLAIYVFRHQIENIIRWIVVLSFYATIIGCMFALVKQRLGIPIRRGGGIWKAIEAMSVAWIAVKFPSRSRRGAKPKMTSYTPGDPLPPSGKPYDWSNDIPY